MKDCKTRKVVAHLHWLSLFDAKFKVSETGRQRVLREKRKNVHAGVEGYYTSSGEASVLMYGDRLRQVKYNPYKRGTFYLKNGHPIEAHGIVIFDDVGQVFIV